jgi:peroxiredoxin Q/BCP
MWSRRAILGVCLIGIFGVRNFAISADLPPKVGDKATDFELATVSGEKVQLSKVASQGTVVLIVLRGYPGYQCPLCNKQVKQYLEKADQFKTAGAQVLLVYPGASEKLSERAQEFIKDKTIPSNFQMLVDPDYRFTNAYHLRWDADGETAYPSTFVIGKDLSITYAKVSQEHGGRSKPDEVLKTLTAT